MALDKFEALVGAAEEVQDGWAWATGDFGGYLDAAWSGDDGYQNVVGCHALVELAVVDARPGQGAERIDF